MPHRSLLPFRLRPVSALGTMTATAWLPGAQAAPAGSGAVRMRAVGSATGTGRWDAGKPGIDETVTVRTGGAFRPEFALRAADIRSVALQPL